MNAFVCYNALFLLLGIAASVTCATAFSVPSFELNDGHKMPKVGLGVFRADPGKETYQSVRWALDAGYRLIDTAAAYRNEADVGRAIHESKIPREEIFITTKIDHDGHGYRAALEQVEGCLARLGTTYVDLLLIHSPYGGRIVETWDALIQLREDGKVKSIGVSNFGVQHLEALRRHGRPTPAVNQIEMHPLIYRERLDLIRYCQEHNVRITAYGSLLSGRADRYDEGNLPRIAEAHGGKTVPQILLAWAVQNGFAVIPKSSSSRERQVENMSVLDIALSEEEMTSLSEMEGEPLDEYWDPVKDAEVDVGDLSFGRHVSESEL